MIRRCLQLFFLVVVAACAYAQMPFDPGMPAFHRAPPPRGAHLKPLLAGPQLTGKYFGHPYQVTAYEMAAKVPDVLYQMPCYCRCDLSLGHKSLRSCYEDTHATTCSTCMSEAAYVYQQVRKGASVAQIRDGINRGDYLEVDLNSLAM